jgi:rhamnosyltransferase
VPALFRGARVVPERPVIVGVVPLFETPASAASGLRAIAAQVDRLVLVDDGSGSDVGLFVRGLGLPNAEYVASPENLGIAHALNLGISRALAEPGADLVLTVDQDSIIADDYVSQAVAAVRLLTRRGVHFTAVAAGTVDGRITRGKPLGYLPYRSTRETIQSGMVFTADSLRALGGFDESFFIDCVDTDYILRGSRSGRPTILVEECRMSHAMGDGIPVTLPFFFRNRERRLPYHGPVRRYYITRNRTRLFFRFALSSPGWAVKQTYEQAKSAGADLVYGPDPRGQLSATAYGVWDGLRRRGGRITPERESVLRRERPRGGGSRGS